MDSIMVLMDQMDLKSAKGQEGTFSGLTLLEKLFQKPFNFRPQYQDVLQDITTFMFEDELRIIKKKANMILESNKKTIEDKEKEIYEFADEQMAENYSSENEDEINAAEEHMKQLEVEALELSNMLKDQSAEYTQSMMQNKSESLQHNLESLAKKIKWKKGGLPEAAVQCILNSFDISNVSQVHIQKRQADIISWIGKSRILHEVKCVDALGKHDLAQFKSYSEHLESDNSVKSDKPIIVYHFMRLLTHIVKGGYEAWVKKLTTQLSNVAQSKDVPVFCLFYKEPLLSVKISHHHLDGINPRFISSNLRSLIESSQWKAINKAAEDYKLEEIVVDKVLESVRNSKLILELGEICGKTSRAIADWLKKTDKCPTWIKEGGLQPTDDASVFHTIKILTEYLRCWVVYQKLLVYYDIETRKDEVTGRTIFTGPLNSEYQGLSLDEEQIYPLFDSEYKTQETILIVEKCGFNDFLVKTYSQGKGN